MRLWHQALIPLLPRQQLLGLHREICALRGKGWGRKHATVDYGPPDYIKILDWAEEVYGSDFKPAIRLHSQNPVGVINMRRIIERNGWKEIR